MPQAGGFIVAKFATGAWMTTAAGAAVFKVAAFAINVALMVGLSYLSIKAFGPKFGDDMQGRKIMSRDGAGYRRLIFGECRVSGNVTYAKTTNSTAGETNGYLHFIVCIAGHEIDSYTEFFLGDEQFTVSNSGNDSNGVPRLVPTGGRFAGKVRIKPYFGTDDQPADADLVAETSGDGNWTANHRGRGVAYLYVRLEWDEEVFPSGWPAMVVTVRGWVSDTSSTWTQNCPKLLAEYLQYPKDRGGVGIKPADIDADVLANSVAIANEEVDTYSGGPTQMRYPINIVVPTSDDYANNIQHFLDCMAGWLDWDQGKWLIRAGAYRASSAVLTEENLVGPVHIIGRESIRNSANGIKGIYVSKSEEYEATDFEPFIARAKNPSSSSTIDTSANTITQEGSGLVDGDRVRFEPFPSGSLPGGLVAGLYYYVINSNSTTFQVSTEEGGSAVNLTSAGSNVFHVFDPFLTEDGERIWADLELPGVSDEYTARRLSKIQLLRMRNDLQIVGDFNFSCFQLAVGDTFRLLNNKAGILGLDGVDVAVTLDGDSDFMFSGSPVFDNHDRVAFIALTDGGEKLVLRQYYWVVNRDGNAFQLSRTRGGEPIEIEDGSGTLQLCEGQMFEVLEVKLNASVGENEGETGFFTVRIHAQETQEDLFDWDSGFVSEATFSPDTELPSVRVVGAPTNLAASATAERSYVQGDGEILARVALSWTGAADAFVRSGGYYEIESKRSSATDFIPASTPTASGAQTQVRLLDFELDEDYDFRVRAINSAGNRSAYATLSNFNIGSNLPVPDAPASLGIKISGNSFVLNWSPVAAAFSYEVYVSDDITSTDPIADGELAGKVEGTEFVFRNQRPAVSKAFWVRAKNAVGATSVFSPRADALSTWDSGITKGGFFDDESYPLDDVGGLSEWTQSQRLDPIRTVFLDGEDVGVAGVELEFSGRLVFTNNSSSALNAYVGMGFFRPDVGELISAFLAVVESVPANGTSTRVVKVKTRFFDGGGFANDMVTTLYGSSDTAVDADMSVELFGVQIRVQALRD